MRHLLLLSAVTAAALSVYVPLPAPYSDHCILDDGTDLYDPAHQFDIPWFNIDLDKPPRERWTQVASIYGQNIDRLINVLAQLVLPIFPDAFEVIDDVFGDMADKIPQPYQDELRSISESSGVALGRIVVYNIFYEIFTVCTSVIAQDQNGELIHARNLDFGLFLGWNATTHNWSISEALRTMIINVNWIKDGKILYKSNNFAGFVGIYNGLKQNKFTVTANERFMLDGGYVGILRWLLGMEPNGKWMTWLTRETLETANSYAEAKDMFMNIPMLSPVYYILAGTQPGEGVILSRALNGTDLVNSLEPEKPDGWFLLQTNYDPNVAPLFLDDRRTPGNKCMKTMGQHNVGFRSIYNVLSSKTNLNKLTTYTVLMNVKTGQFETHTQGCPGYCWPF